MNYPDVAAAIRARNERIAADYTAGIPVRIIAEQSGVSASSVAAIARAFGGSRQRGPAPGSSNPARDKEIAEQYLSGMTLEAVAMIYRITRERVRQILARDGVEERHNGFLAPRRIAARQKKLTAAERRDKRKSDRIARQQRIRDLYNSGLTYAQICETTGQSLALVEKDVWATGGPSRNAMAGKARIKMTNSDREEILSLYAQNVSLPAIGKRFNLTPESVRNLVYKFGGKRTRKNEMVAGT